MTNTAFRYLAGTPLHAVRSALESALLGWALYAFTTALIYLLTADSPALGEAAFPDALRVATGLWALAYGAAMPFGGATLGLVPLGATALLTWLYRVSVNRADLREPSHLALSVGLYCATVWALIFAAGPGGQNPWWSLAGVPLVAGAGALWGSDLLRGYVRDWTHTYLPEPVRAGLRLAAINLVVLGALALVLALVSLVGAWPQINAINKSLDPGIIGTIVLAAVQLTYLPTVGVWGLYYLAGGKLWAGTGQTVSLSHIELSEIPAVPLLGVLPKQSASPWLTLIIVAVLAACALIFNRRWASRLDARGIVTACTTGTTALLLATAFGIYATRGPLGQGLMGRFGPDTVTSFLWSALWIITTTAIFSILPHRDVRPILAQALRGMVSRLTGGRIGRQ